MQKDAFIQASTRVRIAEKSLLTKDQLNRLAETDSIEELNRILAETSYQAAVSKLTDPEDYEVMLDQTLKDLYAFAYDASPEPKIVDLFALRYVSHNLKVLAKELLQKTDLSKLYVPIGDLPIEALKEAEETGTLHREGPYGEALQKILDDYRDKKDPGRIDALADRFYAERLSAIAAEVNVPVITQYAQDMVDLYNLMALFRAKRAEYPLDAYQETVLTGGNLYMPQLYSRYFEPIEQIAQSLYSMKIGDAVKHGLAQYEATGRLSSFEQQAENHFMRLAQGSKMISYGPEVILSYLISKETEIKNLRILYVSKRNKMSQDFTRERLRLTYV